MGNIIDMEEERGPGRVRTPARRASARRRAKTEAYNDALSEFTQRDPVVVAAQGGSVEALYVARDAVAHEAASLLYERQHAVPGSREAARTSSRRIAALAEVGRLTVAIHRANPGEPSPERLGRVMALLRNDVEDAVRGLFDEETAQLLLDEMARRLPRDLASLSVGK
jgi:hypothetical protein